MLLGKIKYNDKVLHQSKILRFYLEGEDKKGSKDIDKIVKKFLKQKYLFQQKT